MDSNNISCEFVKTVVPQMKTIACDTIKAVSRKMDINRRHCSFEIFGYDFMIDEDLKPWLIEVNTNPYLGTPNEAMQLLMPQMVNDMLKIVLDPVMPP